MKLKDFDALAEKLGLLRKVVANSYKRFSSGNDTVKECINRSFLSPEFKEDYWQIWNKRQQLFR